MANEMLAQALGTEFAKRYANSRRSSVTLDRFDTFSIIKQIRENKMDPETASLFYIKDKQRFEVILIETPKTLRVKPTKNTSHSFVSARWTGKWLNLYSSVFDIQRMQPNQTYICVGNMKAGTWKGQPTFTFFLKQLITLEEVMTFDENLKPTEQPAQPADAPTQG